MAIRRRVIRRAPRIYQTTPKTRSSRLSIIFGILVFVLLTGVLVYILFFSGIFNIKNITLIGEQDVNSQEIREIVEEKISGKIIFFPRKQIFLVNSESIRNALENKFLEIKEVKIKKQFPDTLKIEVISRAPRIIWHTNNDYFYVDQDGIAFKKIFKSKVTSDYPIINDISGSEVVLGEKIISQGRASNFITFVEEVLDKLKTKVDVQANSFEVSSRSCYELWVNTKEGWKIYFDTQRSADEQLTALAKVLNEKIGKDRKSLEYVDLRVKNWVYYK